MSHGLADPAGPDDAQGLAAHLLAQKQEWRPVSELALPDPFIAFDQAASRRQDQGKGQVGRGLRQHPRGVGHRQASLGGRGDIDMLEADPEVGDHPQGRGVVEQFRVDPVGNGAEQPLFIRHPPEQAGPVQGRVFSVTLHLMLPPEQR